MKVRNLLCLQLGNENMTRKSCLHCRTTCSPQMYIHMHMLVIVGTQLLNCEYPGSRCLKFIPRTLCHTNIEDVDGLVFSQCVREF